MSPWAESTVLIYEGRRRHEDQLEVLLYQVLVESRQRGRDDKREWEPCDVVASTGASILHIFFLNSTQRKARSKKRMSRLQLGEVKKGQ